jgi:hypothetical protein
MLFRKKHPTESSAYENIAPASLGAYKGIVNAFKEVQLGIASGIKNRFADNSNVVNYATNISKDAMAIQQRWDKAFADLDEASTNGGVICQFDWSDGKKKETGLLVLRSGEIIKRDVLNVTLIW